MLLLLCARSSTGTEERSPRRGEGGKRGKGQPHAAHTLHFSGRVRERSVQRTGLKVRGTK